MSKFIALPVGMGDAFYLEREDIRILVDGGASQKNISGFVTDIASTDYLDVVICTHNDFDHANGIIGLLENWTGKIKEVWVPATWSYKLKQLFDNEENFIIELAKEVMEYPEDIKKINDIDIDTFSIESLETKVDTIFNLEELLDSESMLDSKLDNIFIKSVLYRILFPIYGMSYHKFKLFIDAIDTAKRIKKIIDIAYRQRGCKIRFFEFGSTISGGISNQLEPVNSKEIMQLHTQNITILQYLALTKVNKESLVFNACETEDEPAVLFTADSDLNFSLSNVNISRPLIITAPHHGAETNQHAYTQVNNLTKGITPIWVRSDCKSKRPGSSYKAQTLRACTLCNDNLETKVSVQINSVGNIWNFRNNICTCT